MQPPHTQAETYLPNSPGSTVQGSELGAGRSPHSLSSCSSLSHLPEGSRNFTRTPPVMPVPASTPYSTLPVPPEKGQRCKMPEGCPKGTVMQWEVAGPPQRGPATWERDVSPPEGSRIQGQEGRSELGSGVLGFLSLSCSSQGCTVTPAKFCFQGFPGTLARPKPMAYNQILFL